MIKPIPLALSASFAALTFHAAATTQTGISLQPVSINKHVKNNRISKRFDESSTLDSTTYRYIVQFDDASVATYNGTINGLAATNPTKQSGTKKLDTERSEVKAYNQYLAKKQSAMLSKLSLSVGIDTAIKQFSYSLNGAVIEATPAQAQQIASISGVRSIERDQVFTLTTDTSYQLLGADQLWQGSVGSAGAVLGENVVVGILDTGINTDHPAFAATGGDGYTHVNPLGSGQYLGDCETEAPTLCNDKLIGVYSYNVLTNAYNDTSVFPVGLAQTGEDYNGHGSHVASTAAGNILYNVPELGLEYGNETGDGTVGSFTFDQTSGIAPHANIISFQVCLPGEDGDSYTGCYASASIAAIEDAIETGIVDVLNYSVSGGGYPWSGSLNAAWLSARNAGIFVAHAAGNEGPDSETTEKHAPWLTAVAATSHGRYVTHEKTMSNFTGGGTSPGTLSGASNSGAITASVVYAGDYTNSNDPDGDPAQCLEPFPAGTFDGEIVVCERGEIARVQKAINVAEGGAGGYVLINLDGGAENVVGDVYVIPGIHLDAAQGESLMTWLSTGTNHSATISEADSEVLSDGTEDMVASFSSRGPNTSISTLTPAVAAPGVSIYAAYADEMYGHDITEPAPADWAYLDGTSMASPQVAGAAALLKAAHPDWTPDNIRSALAMTAKTGLIDYDGSEANWHTSGSGRIQIEQATLAGLVMDESDANYEAADPDEGGEPRALNLPSFTDNNCLITCTWQRTVTATTAGTWSVTTDSMESGLSISVSPSSFSLAAGESQTLDITVETGSADAESWSYGRVNLTSSSSPDLHLPVSVIASNSTVEESVDITAHRDRDSYLMQDVVAVEITDFQSTVYGLTAATLTTGTVKQDSDAFDPFDDLTDGVVMVPITIDDAVRFVATINSTTSLDMDIYLVYDYDQNGEATDDEIVAMSINSGSTEYIDVLAPEAGDYWLIIHNFFGDSQQGDSYEVAYAAVTSTVDASLTVDAPSSNAASTPFDIRFLWDIDGAEQGDQYFGAVAMGSSATTPDNLGLVGVDITRGADDVQIISNSDGRLSIGDTADYTVRVLANDTNEDRDYVISVTLPDEISVVESSLGDNAQLTDNTITWELTQTTDAGTSFVNATSVDSSQCSTVNVGQGSGYIDLAALDIAPVNLNTDEQDTLAINFSGTIEYFGKTYSSFTVTDDGFIQLGNGDTGTQPWINQKLADTTSPNAVIAPLWRDMTFDSNSNLYVAQFNNGLTTVVEWQQMRDQTTGQRFSFEAIMHKTASGESDIQFAYQGVSLSDATATTIGVEDDTGSTGVPLYYTGTSENTVNSDVLEAVESDGTLCLSRVSEGLASTDVDLDFTVTLSAGTAEVDSIQLIAVSTVPNIPGTVSYASENNAVQIHAGPVITIDGSTENTELSVSEGTTYTLPVSIEDPNGDDFSVSWSQSGAVSVEFDDTTIAAPTITTPEVDEASTTTLTVTATDSYGYTTTRTIVLTVAINQPPTLEVTYDTQVQEGSSFTITASGTDPEGDDLTFTINGVTGSSYSATAPTVDEDTSVTYTVSVTDGFNTVSDTITFTVTNKPKSGGSMGYILVVLLVLLGVRRTPIKK